MAAEGRDVLLVHAGQDAHWLPELSAAYRLVFDFVEQPRRDGFAAWWRGDARAPLYAAEVVVDAAELNGGFRQQGLNRLFTQVLVEAAPSLVVVAGLYGCTLDLARMARFMGLPVIWLVDGASLQRLNAVGELDGPWVAHALAAAKAWVACGESTESVAMLASLPRHEPAALAALTQSWLAQVEPSRGFDYARYEFCMRDHPLLMQMQAGLVEHFRGCQRVLDLGCGAGIFLDALRRAGISALGVERDAAIADYARGMGLEVITEDALAFIQAEGELFDGVSCSHFIEHLPFEAVERLLEAIAARLKPGGVVLLVFPDPESIRMQLQWFWRDPEHVRFYHVELVKAVAASHGLMCEWANYDPASHAVGGFPMEAPPMPVVALPDLPARQDKPGFWGRVLARLGLVSRGRHAALAQRVDGLQEALMSSMQAQQAALACLHTRTERLWEVNRSWGWDDSAILRLRKR